MFGLGLGRLGLSSGGKSLAAQIMAMGPKLWLEPSVSGGYQDSAGTTPLYAPGGGSVDPPVGLALDKSQGLVLGPELVTNGDFSNGTTGWTGTAVVSTTDGTFTEVAGQAKITINPGGYNYWAYQSFTTVVGNTCRVGGTIVSKSGAPSLVSVRKADNNNMLSPVNQVNVLLAVGATSLVFTATATTTYIVIQVNGVSGESATFDNISVREIPGNHASQATSTARPVLSARKNLLLATATLSTQNVTTVAGQYTIQFGGAGSVTASGTYAGVLTSGQTFTATAGTLTLTVAGSVTSAQLEVGAVATGYQSITDANTYDASAAPLIHKFDGVDDVHNVTFPSSLGSACTVVTANRYAAPTILTAQTIGTSLAINASHCGKLVFDRALTAGETAVVTAWANKQGGL